MTGKQRQAVPVPPWPFKFHDAHFARFDPRGEHNPVSGTGPHRLNTSANMGKGTGKAHCKFNHHKLELNTGLARLSFSYVQNRKPSWGPRGGHQSRD